nr:hypothetical protein [Tanacetum cinerariifolium]
MKVKESLNVTFDESSPLTKLSSLVDDDVGEEEVIIMNTKIVNTKTKDDELIEVDEVVNIKESKNHPLDQVIGNLNQRTLRSDNGTEFKNNDLNQFCGIKEIKREFSVPRTPQQNGIAERKNRTLIEAARTMLPDSLLPIPFWVEAVNTACYVQNRVLVTKPHNKTPYELLHGKFDGKVGEGFLVGYSVSSKAFRVFNSRTRIVQETLHVNFLENKPNVAGSGPTWLFDINTLTKTMNYQSVTAGNQFNNSAGVQEQFDTEKAGEESVQQYVIFPVWSTVSTNPQNTDGDAAFDEKEPEFEGRKPGSEANVSSSSSAYINEDNAACTLVPAVGQLIPNSTNTFSAADDVGAKADFNNLETSIKVSHIPTTRVHKDQPVTQIIGDLSSATQTKKEPKRVHQALKDPSWIKAMQEELLQFKMQKVWVLVDLPHGKRAIGAKWVFRNKQDERGIVVRNKAQLVAQEHTQEKGINYEEVFAPVTRIEAIRLFLAYASFMGFMVYQMDVKSAFMYGTIEDVLALILYKSNKNVIGPISQSSQQAATRNKGKAIVKYPPPIYDQEPTMVAEDDEMSKDKEIDKLVALISLSFKKIYKPTNNNLRTSSNTSRANRDNSPRINRGTGKNVGTTVVQQSGIQCYNCKEYRHVAREYQELEAHYMYMAQIQEVTPDVVDNSGPIFVTESLQKVPNNDNYNVFAIKNEHPEQSKSIHDTYLIEQDEHNVIINSLDISYDREQIDHNDDDDDLANERDLLASLIEKLKCEIDDNKNRNKFLETSNKALVNKLKSENEDFKTKNKSLESSNNQFKEANNELSKKNQLMFKDLKKFQAELDRYNDVKYASKEMVADLRYFNSFKLEVDSLKSQLETQKTQFLNEINRLSKEYYYADHMNAILGVFTELDEVTNLQCDYLKTLEKCECLEKELSKSKMMSKIFEALQKHAINLELDLQQCQKKIKNDKSFKENQSKEFRRDREQYFEIQDLKAQLQDKGIAISKLKKLREKLKGKSVETKFEKSSVIRQPNAFKSQRPSILGVIHSTSVSRPQLKSNQMEDRVMLNNSQGKKQKVEDRHRNVKFSNNKTSVTACNDNLKAKTLNVNFICVTCGKCVLNDNHDKCVLHYLNCVNSRTKKPMVVPISTRESKCSINQSVVTPLRRTVASEFTNQKPRHTTRKLYESVSKTCSWWYPKFTPPGYK